MNKVDRLIKDILCLRDSDLKVYKKLSDLDKYIDIYKLSELMQRDRSNIIVRVNILIKKGLVTKRQTKHNPRIYEYKIDKVKINSIKNKLISDIDKQTNRDVMDVRRW